MRAEVTSANAAPECGRRLPPLTSICLPWRMLRGITRYSQDPMWTGTRHGTPGRWETTVLMLGLLPVPGHTRCSLISSWPRCLSLLISKANFKHVAARNACEGLLVPSRCACSNTPPVECSVREMSPMFSTKPVRPTRIPGRSVGTRDIQNKSSQQIW